MEYYKVFYTDKSLPGAVKPNLSLMMPLSFASKDEALNEAFKLIFRGAVVWKIEGPAGFYVDRAQVERLYGKFRTPDAA